MNPLSNNSLHKFSIIIKITSFPEKKKKNLKKNSKKTLKQQFVLFSHIKKVQIMFRVFYCWSKKHNKPCLHLWLLTMSAMTPQTLIECGQPCYKQQKCHLLLLEALTPKSSLTITRIKHLARGDNSTPWSHIQNET